jgi:hypothetical protein
VPSYEYRCDACDLTFRSDWRDDTVMCLRCTRWARRVWGFSVLPAGPSAEHRSELARASEKASAPRGIWDAGGNKTIVTPPEHRYAPIDLRDKEACGVTDEGLPETYDALRRAGNDPAADHLRKVMGP